jgi:colanic acid/amylovoran biosynthesis protein
VRRLAKRLFPQVSLVCLRETFTGPDSLASLGVSPSRVLVTGDDAIELVYGQRRAEPGNGIGINVRVAEYSHVTGEDLDHIARVIRATAARYNAPVVPVPVAFNAAESDLTRIQSMLATEPFLDDQPDSPQAVIRQVSRCRVVVTGSYHAGVFALAQGIPAIGLFRSPYYRDKFGGLVSQFGGGCLTVSLDGADFGERLDRAIESAWLSAADLRQPLLSAAARQIQAGEEAYQRLSSLVHPGNPTSE